MEDKNISETSVLESDASSCDKSRCCNNFIFMDNFSQFSCMLFSVFIPGTVIFIAFVIAGAVILSQGSYVVGGVLLGIGVVVPALLYICFSIYVRWYRKKYSQKIGSKGYFPCCC